MPNVYFAKSIEKDWVKIDESMKLIIKEKIVQLEQFPNLSQIKKLTRHPLAEYRLRVGDYRVLFDYDKPTNSIFILKIGHRKDVY